MQNTGQALNEKAYILAYTHFSEISDFLLRHSGDDARRERIDLNLVPEEISINAATFSNVVNRNISLSVAVLQQDKQLIISCSCEDPGGRLCVHQYQTLQNLAEREELRIFFDKELRNERFKKLAADYGLEHETDLDLYFSVTYKQGKLEVQPKDGASLPVSSQNLKAFKQTLQAGLASIEQGPRTSETGVMCLILKQHKYYRHLYIELIVAETTKAGKPKNHFISINPLEEIWKTGDPQIIKFFSAISRFQNNIDDKKGPADLAFLESIVGNPLSIPVYLHNSDVSENISAASVSPIDLAILQEDISLEVNQKGSFFELKGSLKIGNKSYSPVELQIRFNHFIQVATVLYLVRSTAVPALIELFKGKGKTLKIHQSRFAEFRDQVLNELENTIPLAHNYLKEASERQKGDASSAPLEKILYLSDFGQHISIVPVVRYGDTEIPVRTKRQIIAADDLGKEYLVNRDTAIEDDFIALLLKQHPDFTEQLDNPLQYFYLHKKRFLDEDWFLKAFDDWDNNGITILGFDEITERKLNPQKAKVTIQVTSGVNWFNTDIDLRFGKKKASLKQLRQSLKSKSRYVRLDDGTTGIIPNEWIEKFSTWFAAAELVEDTLRTPRTSFATLNEIYEEAVLSEEVKAEIRVYNEKLRDYKEIRDVDIPASLVATLRPYQKHGLNWLNFLDEFNFGGCLADDMGLGKSLQIIAFILSQREKRGLCTSMIVVPTSLIFNWQAEFEKFAPSLKVHTAYGASRTKNIREFDQFEVILTSYGTLVSDIGYFKKFNFHYVFFDESQNIKNPQSQRYMAARALNSRSKIVITGTPIENNTFDLYGQLSIACPGLLGSLTYFRDVYSSPIDKFGVKKRAEELQRKIEPFILRRTKDQVAPELPEKIEMVIYCEMKEEQRKVYDAYEKEFREYISSKTDEDLKKSPMHVLKGITRLRQICDAPALAGEKTPDSKTSSKIETLISHIEDHSSGHKILVFSQFVTMLDLIREQLDEKGIPYSYLTGKTKDREAVINEYQNNPEIRVFLISLKAGGTGLNLTEANYVYIVDPWWNPAVENQAIDRCHRIGQKKNVVAVRLICPDTVEEKIMKLQQSKIARMDGLIKTDSRMIKSLSHADLVGLLSHS